VFNYLFLASLSYSAVVVSSAGSVQPSKAVVFSIYKHIIRVLDFSESVTISYVILCLSHETSFTEATGLVAQVDASILNCIFCSQRPLGSYEITT